MSHSTLKVSPSVHHIRSARSKRSIASRSTHDGVFPGEASPQPSMARRSTNDVSKLGQSTRRDTNEPHTSFSRRIRKSESTPRESEVDPRSQGYFRGAVAMATAEQISLVAVTSVDTYLPIHVARRVLTSNAHVRGSVKPAQMENISRAFLSLPEDKLNLLELFPLDLLDGEDTWDEFLNDVHVVVHNVTPIPSGVRLSQALPTTCDADVDQAVQEVKNMIAASVRSASVKRIVLITSIATIAWNPSKGGNTTPFDETDYEDENELTGYGKCQILAERAATEYVNSLTESDKIDLVILNPGFAIGPVIGGVYSFTLDAILQLLGKSPNSVPEVTVPYIDARDVAEAAFQGINEKSMIDKRHILVGSSVPLQTVVSILLREFTKEGYTFGSRHECVLSWLTCLVCRRPRVALGPLYDTMYGEPIAYNTRRMTQELGIQPLNLEETIIETAYSMLYWNMLNIQKRKLS